jgi:L-asparaginase/Glu-tRNA(Gln) amidotransferase subunit D
VTGTVKRVARDRPGAKRFATLGVVITGGTLGSRIGISDLVVLDSHHEPPEWPLVQAAAEPFGLALVRQAPFRLSSEEMQPRHWLRIGGACRALVSQGADAVMVLHGTDTAAYTAAALSLLLADLDVPIAVTGANIPPALMNSDAPTNLAGAIAALASLDRGVVLSFAGTAGGRSVVHSGTHVRKTSLDAGTFSSVNASPVGHVEPTEGFVLRRPLSGTPAGLRFSGDRVEAKVLTVRCHPGADFAAMAVAARQARARGIVLELYESSTAPSVGSASASAARFVRECTALGATVVGVTPSGGRATDRVYESTVRLEAAGMVRPSGLLPEVALVKLMLALGATDDPQEAGAMVLEPAADEFASNEVAPSPTIALGRRANKL